jgi:hypothetical protein
MAKRFETAKTQSGHLANRQRDRVGFANGLTRKIAG